MKATEFDKKFDAGEDVSGAIDWSQTRRPNDQPKRVNVDPGVSRRGLGQAGSAPGRDATIAD